jgi:hypothetical protein
MSDIGQELETAIRRVVVARDRLKAASPDSAGYQTVKLEYLEATVHHLAVLAIAQAQQYEDLTEEVDELRARLNGLQPRMH